mmetsp:Transcript_43695/g.106826  ORF Transcript_43695/g.106826 Transcript_43695/m.106826 type:complete len:375 (+) Transcript_43695:139-1263(+)
MELKLGTHCHLCSIKITDFLSNAKQCDKGKMAKQQEGTWVMAGWLELQTTHQICCNCALQHGWASYEQKACTNCKVRRQNLQVQPPAQAPPPPPPSRPLPAPPAQIHSAPRNGAPPAQSQSENSDEYFAFPIHHKQGSPPVSRREEQERETARAALAADLTALGYPLALCKEALERNGEDVEAAAGWLLDSQSTRRHEYFAFLSHYKQEAAMDARYLKEKMEQEVGGGETMFLDSDNLKDLRVLIANVKKSKTLVLIQTQKVLSRPWCLIELYTALQHHIPIVPVCVEGKGWVHGALSGPELLSAEDKATMASELGVGADVIVDTILASLPKLISQPFSPCASSGVLKAQVVDIVAACRAQAFHHRGVTQPGAS